MSAAEMDAKRLGFAVFVIHALAAEWRRPCGWVYRALNDSGLLDDYILAFYDVLHPQGREYLVEDITEFARDKGIDV